MSYKEIRTQETTDEETGKVTRKTTFGATQPFAGKAVEGFLQIMDRAFSDQNLEVTGRKRFIDGETVTVTSKPISK